MIDAIFMPIGALRDFSVNAIVVTTSRPVVAATERWKYSIIKSLPGISPFGQSGQSGQVRPTPDALTYPPIKINEKSTKREEKERVLSRFIGYLLLLHH